MILINYNFTGLTEASQYFKELALRAPRVLAESMQESGNKTISRLAKQIIVDNNNVVTKKLVGSLKAVANLVGNEVTLTIATFNVFYGVDIERGTKPHTVPIDELIEWARLKFKLPRRPPVGRVKSNRGRPRRKKYADDVAYAVQKVIEVQGTYAYPFLETAFDTNKEFFILSTLALARKKLGLQL